MRMHIVPKICHFLVLVQRITEVRKTNIWTKSYVHSPPPCRGSTLEQKFCLQCVQKGLNIDVSGASNRL